MRRPAPDPPARAMWAASLVALIVGGCGGDEGSAAGPRTRTRDDSPALAAGVRTACAACHDLPPPDAHPRGDWRAEVERGYRFLETSRLGIVAPPIEDVVAWYEDRAKETLAPPRVRFATSPPPFELAREGPPSVPAVGGRRPDRRTTNVLVAPLSDPVRAEIILCDGGVPASTGLGAVLALRPFDAQPSWRVLAELPTPVHTEIVDLDGDGRRDLLVACLGSLNPTDELLGSVVWLRGRPDGTFAPHVLLDHAPRVTDVRAAPLRRADRLDLVVAAFGYRDTGKILVLENETSDYDAPRFVPRTLDDRHGAIHVPVTDLDGDGRPDVVALISQEHECVVAYVNGPDGTFARKTLYAAPHPSYGSSGIELADMDGDGDRDVLYTNGDALNPPFVRKPYHGVQWLENPGARPGGPTVPWARHEVGALYGVHRALPIDSAGTGKPDVLAVTFLPGRHFADRGERELDAVVLFERLPDGSYVRHSLESATCDHVTCALGDVTGDGGIDLVVGNMPTTPDRLVTVWRNLGRRR